MCVPYSSSPDKSNSAKPTTGNKIFDIPAHPSRPKEYNIDEPAPLKVRKVLKAQNTNEDLMAPAAGAPKVRHPIEVVLQELENSVATVEELAEIETEVERLDHRVAAAWAYVVDKSGSKMRSPTVPDDTPATGWNRGKATANLEGREYILLLKSVAAEERAKVKRQAVYVPTVPPGCFESARVDRRSMFEDNSEEIGDRSKEKRREKATYSEAEGGGRG